MSKTFFISDLHLEESKPIIIELFLDFLQQTAPGAKALYILGDLFEVWIGDDELTPLQLQVSQALKQLSNRGIPIYFIHGNRDFLLGKTYAQLAGMTLLPDPTLINLYGKQALLMHGDTLCIEDVKYQAFRKKARNRFNQWLFLTLPIKLRKKIANGLRAKSQKYTSQTEPIIMDVTSQAVEQAFQSTGVNLIIHGHTHRPAIHRWHEKIRVVLPMWHTQGGYLEYQDSQQFFLNYFDNNGYNRLT